MGIQISMISWDWWNQGRNSILISTLSYPCCLFVCVCVGENLFFLVLRYVCTREINLQGELYNLTFEDHFLFICFLVIVVLLVTVRWRSLLHQLLVLWLIWRYRTVASPIILFLTNLGKILNYWVLLVLSLVSMHCL